MDVVTHDHAWPERHDMPAAVTRIRFGLCEGLIAPRTMVGSQFIRPLYRPANAYGFRDGPHEVGA